MDPQGRLNARLVVAHMWCGSGTSAGRSAGRFRPPMPVREGGGRGLRFFLVGLVRGSRFFLAGRFFLAEPARGPRFFLAGLAAAGGGCPEKVLSGA